MLKKSDFIFLILLGLFLAVAIVFFSLTKGKEPTYEDLFPNEVREGTVTAVNSIDPTGTWYAVRIKDYYAGKVVERDILAHAEMVRLLEPGVNVFYTFVTSKPYFKFDVTVLLPTQPTGKLITEGKLKFLQPPRTK